MGKTRIKFRVAGITFAQKDDPAVLALRPTRDFEVRPEPENEHDPKALAVICKGHKVGYVPAKSGAQEKIHSLIAGDKDWSLTLEGYRYRDGNGVNRWNDEHRGMLGSLTLCLICDDEDDASDKPTAGGKMMRSMSESDVEVEFFEGPHEYWHGSKRLGSVTHLVKQMYPEFNAEAVAFRVCDKWGMQAQDILNMWEVNRDLAACFGTAVHAAVENYTNYGDRGLPKMPLFREIAESFPGKMANVRCEQLITAVDRGLCGLVDRVVEIGDELQVQDMKANVEFDKADAKKYKNRLFPELPNTKVGKTVCQMSIYADILERGGRKVAPTVVAWAWDGTWRRFEHDRIVGILDKIGDQL